MAETKEEKKDLSLTIAVIGLIGTIIAAILGSPLLVDLIEKNRATDTPTAPAATQDPAGGNQILVFQEDFDSDNISGFAFENGEWSIGKDRSNQILEGSAPTLPAKAVFGPSDFSNGVIEFFIRVDRFAGEAAVNFRASGQGAYSLSFGRNLVRLGFRKSANDLDLEPFNADSSRSLVFEQGVWYLVRIDARGSRITVFIDNNRIFSASDDRLATGGLDFSLQTGFEASFDDVKVWDLR